MNTVKVIFNSPGNNQFQEGTPFLTDKIKRYSVRTPPGIGTLVVKVCPPAHNYEHEAGSYGDGFT